MKLIPKILHMYWDLSPMSWLQALTPVSFRKHNPDWEMNIYIPKQSYGGNARYIPNYTGKDYFDVTKQVSGINFIEVDMDDYGIDTQHHNILRSDILRYHLLYNHGGVWSDFDIVWLKPMTHFDNIEYHGSTPVDEITSVVSLMKDTTGGHSIGVLIHRQYDEYAKALIDLTKQVKPPFGHEVFGSEMITTRYPTLKSLSEFEGLVGVKHETYYPYDIHPPTPTFDKLYMEKDLRPINNNVLCLHWYNGKELSKHYIHNDGFKVDCSMTAVLRGEGYI